MTCRVSHSRVGERYQGPEATPGSTAVAMTFTVRFPQRYRSDWLGTMKHAPMRLEQGGLPRLLGKASSIASRSVYHHESYAIQVMTEKDICVARSDLVASKRQTI